VKRGKTIARAEKANKLKTTMSVNQNTNTTNQKLENMSFPN